MAITFRDIRVLSDAADLDDYEKRGKMNKDHMLTADKAVMDMQQQKIAELEARLREAEAALVETIEDATEGAEKHIQRAKKAEAQRDGLRIELKERDALIAELRARAEALRAALERIIKRTEGCAPLVATDVRRIAQAALGPEQPAIKENAGNVE